MDLTFSDNVAVTFPGTNNLWTTPYQEWSPTYIGTYLYPHQSQPNKIEQAFKICQKLLEKNLVKIENVKEFIELVNTISQTL